MYSQIIKGFLGFIFLTLFLISPSYSNSLSSADFKPADISEKTAKANSYNPNILYNIVANQIHTTDEQKQMVEKITSQANEARKKILGLEQKTAQPLPLTEEQRKQIRASNAQHASKIRDILTPIQNEAVDEILLYHAKVMAERYNISSFSLYDKLTLDAGQRERAEDIFLKHKAAAAEEFKTLLTPQQLEIYDNIYQEILDEETRLGQEKTK